MVGQQAEGLPGQDRVPELDPQLLHLEPRVGRGPARPPRGGDGNVCDERPLLDRGYLFRGEPAGGPDLRGVFVFNGGLFTDGHSHP